MKKQSTQDAVVLAVVAATLGMAFPEISLAQVSDLRGVADQGIQQIGTLPGLVTGILFLGGVVFAGLGVLDLKKHADNASQTPLKNGIVKLLVGGAMVAIPALTGVLESTIGLQGSGVAPSINELNF
jgi:hypothetical protein